ncbi:hypothetical protein LCGC14_1848910 [marine sediment metagenome]|uniref:Uncharacterized protein n=1 Tax=marine sediment metagenome TaxID=412755 RepID=A0A0F9GZ82_9ZZZZ
MSTKLFAVQECVCDQCKQMVVLKDEEGSVEGQLPTGWMELAARHLATNLPRGNEALFADLCPECYNKLPFSFHPIDDSHE